jgi:geranylgeranyl diphosphate synthase, type II
MIDLKLEQILSRIENQTLREACHYSLFSGGKRIRPLMLLSISGQLGLDVGCAIEMIHTYTLIHDDLPSMDNDDIRRGNPTLHKVYDEATAILAGDLLLTMAFEVITESPLEPALIIRIIRDISKNIGGNGLIVGQHLDILSKSKTINWDEHKTISLRKTADLFTTSLVSGALIKGLSDDQISTYSQFGQTFGLLYQLKDDLDDHNSPVPISDLIPIKELLFSHAEHLLSMLSIENSFLRDCLTSLSTIAVTEISLQTLSAVSHMSKNA